MLQQEFEQRTKVQVSVEEFETINEFYMSVECDKDEFCRLWVKMNPEKVMKAKNQSKAKEEESKLHAQLHKIYEKMRNSKYIRSAKTILTIKEEIILDKASVRYDEFDDTYALAYAIGCRLQLFK